MFSYLLICCFIFNTVCICVCVYFLALERDVLFILQNFPIKAAQVITALVDLT